MAWFKVIFDGFELVPTHWFHHWFQLWFHPLRFLADIFPSRGSWGLKFLLGVGDIGGYVSPKWEPLGCIIKETTAILNPEANHAIFALIIYSRLLIYAMMSRADTPLSMRTTKITSRCSSEHAQSRLGLHYIFMPTYLCVKVEQGGGASVLAAILAKIRNFKSQSLSAFSIQNTSLHLITYANELQSWTRRWGFHVGGHFGENLNFPTLITQRS